MKEMKVVCDKCKQVHAITLDNKPVPPDQRWGFLQGWGTFAIEVPGKQKQARGVELCPTCALAFLAWLHTGPAPTTVEVAIVDNGKSKPRARKRVTP
jgi:hypothetical protein